MAADMTTFPASYYQAFTSQLANAVEIVVEADYAQEPLILPLCTTKPSRAATELRQFLLCRDATDKAQLTNGSPESVLRLREHQGSWTIKDSIFDLIGVSR